MMIKYIMQQNEYEDNFRDNRNDIITDVNESEL